MSGTSLKIKAIFNDVEACEHVYSTLKGALKPPEVDFSEALKQLNADAENTYPENWSLLSIASFNTCLELQLYGKGDETEVCKTLESLGVRLVSVTGFNDQVAEYFEFGWRNGRSIKQRTVNSELKKLDPHLAYQESIIKGRVAQVEKFIAEEAKVNDNLRIGLTPLMVAAYYGRDKVISLLLEHGADINFSLNDDANPLIYSLVEICQQIDYNKTTSLKLLLDHGADPNVILANPGVEFYDKLKTDPPRHVSPLMIAASCSVDAVSLLLEYGADVNLSNKQGHTALMCALTTFGSASIPITRILVECGADVNAEDAAGNNCLSYISPSSGSDYVLRKNGAKYQPVEYTGNAFDDIFLAVGTNDFDKVRALAGKVDISKPRLVGEYKHWLLEDAISMRRFEIAKYLIALNPECVTLLDAQLLEYDWITNSSIQLAAKAGRVDMLRLLLDHGADPQIVTKSSKTALDFALKSTLPPEYSDLPEIAKILLQSGVPTGEAFENAVRHGSSDLVAIFHDAGAFEKVNDPASIFLAVASAENMDFIENYSDWMLQNNFSLFYLTPDSRDIKSLQFQVKASLHFISKGINVNKFFDNNYYCSPIHAAIRALVASGSLKNERSHLLIQLLDALLEAGADPNETCKSFDISVLMRLMKKKSAAPILLKLIEHGAQVNYATYLEPGPAYELLSEGKLYEGETTALMLAAVNGNLEYVKILIEYGADSSFINKVEGSILQVAERFKRNNVVTYLKQN